MPVKLLENLLGIELSMHVEGSDENPVPACRLTGGWVGASRLVLPSGNGCGEQRYQDQQGSGESTAEVVFSWKVSPMIEFTRNEVILKGASAGRGTGRMEASTSRLLRPTTRATPRIALPLEGDDGQRRDKLGRITIVTK